MSGIVAPLRDILTRLSGLQVTNGDGNTVGLYARVWNNQIRYEENGELYDFPKPAAFVEIASPVQFKLLGEGYRTADIAFRIHLSHEHYNSEGTFEQDLQIFDLRDKVIGWLTNWYLTGCTPLVSIGEDQDYEHRNTYHYVVEFVCNFIDDKGSKDDPAKWDAFQYTVDPVDPILDVAVETTVGGQTQGFGYVIPKRKT